MRIATLLVMVAGLGGCDRFTSDLGQSDDDVLSVNIPSQQPSSDLGVVTELSVFSQSPAPVRVDVQAGKADAGTGVASTLCLGVTGGRSEHFVINVSPTNGSALMRVSLLAQAANDAGAACSGDVRRTIEVIVQRPATNPPADGGVP